MRLAMVCLVLVGASAGCASTREVQALRGVDFGLVGIERRQLAGRDVSTATSVGDLSPGTAAVVAASLAQGTLPLTFDVVVSARNPSENPPARLTRFDWTLYLDDREAVRGVFDDERAIAPGDSVTFAVPVRVDLVELAQERGPELLDLAFAVAGRRADPSRLRLTARPTVSTPLGRLRADEVTVLTRTVGGRDTTQTDRAPAPR